MRAKKPEMSYAVWDAEPFYVLKREMFAIESLHIPGIEKDALRQRAQVKWENRSHKSHACAPRGIDHEIEEFF